MKKNKLLNVNKVNWFLVIHSLVTCPWCPWPYIWVQDLELTRDSYEIFSHHVFPLFADQESNRNLIGKSFNSSTNIYRNYNLTNLFYSCVLLHTSVFLLNKFNGNIIKKNNKCDYFLVCPQSDKRREWINSTIVV